MRANEALKDLSMPAFARPSQHDTDFFFAASLREVRTSSTVSQ